MCVVASIELARSFRAQLEPLGYEHRPDESVPDRVFFAKGHVAIAHITFHLLKLSSRFYNEKLLFRITYDPTQRQPKNTVDSK